MARDIILEISDSLRSTASASDIEEMCRYEVAQEMEYQDRILDDAEIEDIVDDIVTDEVSADPMDNIGEDGIVRMTDAEWGNVPDTYKVIDTDGDESAIIDGSVYKVSLREDDSAQRIAAKIAAEIESAWRLRNASLGIDIDKESYKRTASDIESACPDCGSMNQTAVWYEGDTQYIHCNECGCEYEASIGDDASVEETTAEDITIYDDEDASVFGSVFYDGELGWTWQIWCNGECIEQQLADDAGDAYGIFNAIKRCYEDIAIGEILKSTDGKECVVEDIVGDDIICDCGTIGRARTAIDIVFGNVLVDDSELYGFDVEEGDTFGNLHGEEIEVVEAGETILFVASEMDRYTHDYRSEYRTMGKNAFVGYLVDKGYLV